MARLNITVPDDIVVEAKAAGLNLSRVATAALVDELDRLAKIAALDTYLADLDIRAGPLSGNELADAAAWADQVLGPETPAKSPTRRRRRA